MLQDDFLCDRQLNNYRRVARIFRVGGGGGRVRVSSEGANF